MLFGDSLFQGASAVQDGFSFQGALQNRMPVHTPGETIILVSDPIIDCIRYLDVINRGFSGYNTKNALQLLPQIFLPPSPSNPKIEYLVSNGNRLPCSAFLFVVR